jgi:hypothetical protein
MTARAVRCPCCKQRFIALLDERLNLYPIARGNCQRDSGTSSGCRSHSAPRKRKDKHWCDQGKQVLRDNAERCRDAFKPIRVDWTKMLRIEEPTS